MKKEQYLELCDNINRWNEEYYVNGNTSISEIEYDTMLSQLQEAEKEHPEWIDHRSPLSICGKPIIRVDFEVNESALVGKTVVVSGTFKGEYPRRVIEGLVEEAGGKVITTVGKKTSFIVAGTDMGPSKREKAEKFGIKIISDVEFVEIIKRPTPALP